MNSNPERLRHNLAQLKTMLTGLGLDSSQQAGLFLKYPLILLLNPINVYAKIEGLKVCTRGSRCV